MDEEFDFIIVGAGPAGCVLAHRLSHTPSAPRVLLVEAGSDTDTDTNNNDNSSIHSVANRYLNVQLPHLDWGYTSTPQVHLNNRTIPCGRGRVLGGSTTTNFGVWTVGHAEDFNEWARRVGGDEVWMWDGEKGVRERFRRMVNLHVGDGEEEESWRGVLDREALRRRHANAEGTGMVDLMYNQVCDEFESFCLDAFREFGVEFSGDLNDGNPSGVSIPPVTFYNGSRVTAASAYLASRPKNLTIRTETPIASVMFDEHKRAIGVKTLTGEIIRASKEVILSSGTFNSPKILLLSGVGPADDLKKLSIPVIADLPVGKNLKDHCCVTSTLLLEPDVPGAAISERVRKLRTTIRDPLLWVNVQNPLAWLSSSIVKQSPEFAALDSETRSFLQKVPSFELMMNNSRVGLDVTPLPPGSKTLMLMGAVMNPQSCGSVTLASADPSAAPLIDLNYLSHPYDRRVAIEILRKNIVFSQTPVIKEVTEKRIEGPSIDADDETLFEHCKRSAMPVWHFVSTCKMGRDDDSTAVVDKNFKVRGVHSLRVVDLSVAPVLPNNHTQSTAYLVGETAAEKIIAEYAL